MEIINEYKEKIDNFNTRIVDIHCRLASTNCELKELRQIQKDLDRLTAEYYLFETFCDETIEDTRNQMKNMEAKYKKRKYYLLLWALIPVLGFLITLVLLVKNHIDLKTVQTAESYLNDVEKELTEKSEMIEKNLQSKFAFLDKKLSSYVGSDVEKGQAIYYANEIISNYLDGYDVWPELLDPITQDLMRQMLQKDLQSENDDLEDLLYLARVKNDDEQKLSRKKD